MLLWVGFVFAPTVWRAAHAVLHGDAAGTHRADGKQGFLDRLDLGFDVRHCFALRHESTVSNSPVVESTAKLTVKQLDQ